MYLHGVITLVFEWKDLELVLSKSAYREMHHHTLTMFEILGLLEKGRDCSRSKRKKGTYELCMRYKKKTLKVVVAKSLRYSTNKEVWLITHVGVIK